MAELVEFWTARVKLFPEEKPSLDQALHDLRCAELIEERERQASEKRWQAYLEAERRFWP